MWTPALPRAVLDLDGTRLAVRERACYLPAPDALVVADTHVGRAEASAVQLPLPERDDLRDRLVDLLAAFDPATVVVAGDVVHPFEGPTDRAVETVDALRAVCRDRGARPVLVAGNHDTALDAAVDAPVRDGYRLPDGTFVCHGHERPAVDAPRYVVGHDHPTIAVEGRRRPCVLFGPGTGDDPAVVVLPAFSRLAPGVEVNGMDADDFGSPLVTDADALRPIVYDPDADEELVFPPLGRLRDHL